VIAACGKAPGTSDQAAGSASRPANPETGTAGTTKPASELTPLEAAVKRTVEREVTIPAGTELPAVLDTTIGSDISRVEQPVSAHLSRPLMVDGQAVLPEGSTLAGVVTDATRSAKVKGRAHIAVRFNSVSPVDGDERYSMQTASIARTAEATTKQDAIKIGAPAAGGAIIGGIIGGGDGAAIGAAAGGGAGTAVVLSTRGKEIQLPAGTALRVRLTEPLVVRVKTDN
jgi:hypothetical protein